MKQNEKILNPELFKQYFKPENFLNRDISWIEFNRRVLEEALNPDLPLLDKITLEKIEKEIDLMQNSIFSLWENEIIPKLKENNVLITSIDELSDNEKIQLTDYFYKEIYPVLTPLAFDPGRPFPYISNLSLNYAILIKKPDGDKHFARVKIPNILPRLLCIEKIIGDGIKSNTSKSCTKYVWLDNLIKTNIHILFPGVEILLAKKFRITRDTDIEIQEDEADDLLEVIEENIRLRRFGSVVRLEVEKDMPDFMIETLTENLEIPQQNVQSIDGELGLSDIMILCDLPLHDLKEKPFHPVTNPVFEEDENIFSIMSKRDVILHHPYESFNPVIDFIKKASQDPDVLAIKQTLYRVGPNSPIVKYLIEAADRGKQVAVLVELKARFDEENNIYWARELEKVGAHVVYGLVGLKTHAKMTLIVRKEADGVKRYVHLGTGNYNPTSAKVYTDLGLFTANESIAADVSEIFNYLTGYSEQKKHRKLFVSPINIREHFLELVEREINNVEDGGKGHIILKLNSIVDPHSIAALYEASNRGVKIDLIIRGICCLVPQVPGLSENITVRSIVGRFLEHSRFYYFYNNGNEDLYLSSADLMQRNLDKRVEASFPILDKDIKNKIISTLIEVSLKDNIKTRFLLPTGKYIFNKPVSGEEKICMQEWLMDYASKSYTKIKVGETTY
jgi:polyphosphate kinase